MCAHLAHWIRQSQYDRFDCMLIDQVHLCGLMDVEMLKPGDTYYHTTHRGEIDQSHTIGGSVRMEAELSDSEAK